MDFTQINAHPKSHPKTEQNPKGAGRPKGSKTRKSPAEQRDLATAMHFEQGLSRDEISRRLGMGVHEVQLLIEREHGRREVRADPTIDRSMLSKSAQEKLDSAIRQHKRKLDNEYNQRRIEEIREHIKKIAPDLQKQRSEALRSEQLYREFMAKAKKILSVEEFKLVLSCLHPDSRASVSEERLKRAFQLLEPKKFAITGEK